MAEAARQRRVREEGDLWEAYVAKFLREHLSGKGYEIYRERELPMALRNRLSFHARSIWRVIDLEAISDTKPIFGDVDIVIAKAEQPIVIVSCKLSLHNDGILK